MTTDNRTAPPSASPGRPRRPRRPWRRWGKYVLHALAIGLAVGLVVYLGGEAGGRLIPRFAEWVAGLGAWGPVVFILGYAVATVAFLPGSLLTLAAGALFGLVRGTAYALAGATLGASAAFLVARYVARSAIERRVAGNPRFAAIDRAVSEEGWKIVALLRLSPVFPFNLLNYALGLTRVRFGDYLLACLAMLPGTLLYVYYGKAAGSIALVASAASGASGASGTRGEKGLADWAILGVGLLATVVVTTFVTRLAGRALRRELGEAGESPGEESR